MKKFFIYLFAFIVALATIVIVNNFIFGGIIGLILGGALGVYLANKLIEKLTGSKPKEYHFFKKKN